MKCTNLLCATQHKMNNEHPFITEELHRVD